MATTSKRDAYLQRNYSVTEAEWDRVLESQGGGCAGCGGKGVTRKLHTDHSHKTKVVRGILCASCNSALRKLKDNPDIAEALARYLREPPAVAVLGERIANVKVRRRKRKRNVVGRRPRVPRGKKTPPQDS